jgi:predicted short-subunit dehydrogenase-like oxidoreductase (DUF2520 family)
MRVTIIGAGKVGRAFAAALRKRSHQVELRSARSIRAISRTDADLLLLAVRDGQIRVFAERLASAEAVTRRTVALHLAGALDATPLLPLRGKCGGIGQAHPLLSFAGAEVSLAGGSLVIDGDAAAVRAAKRLARALGMTPRRWPNVDRVLYHAAACVVANGAAALSGAGARILALGGAPSREVAAAIAPLLASVAHNIARCDLPFSLTGPVRRGDHETVGRHLERLRRDASSDLLEVYRASVRAQLPLARALGEASDADLRAIEALVAQKRARSAQRATRRTPR